MLHERVRRVSHIRHALVAAKVPASASSVQEPLALVPVILVPRPKALNNVSARGPTVPHTQALQNVSETTLSHTLGFPVDTGVHRAEALPAREDDRLGAGVALAGNSCDVREVGSPLPTVEAVLPGVAHPHSLHPEFGKPQREPSSVCGLSLLKLQRIVTLAVSASKSLTSPLIGSCLGGMGPNQSPGTVTMIRPLAALALPARTARSVVNASSGRSLSLILCSTENQRQQAPSRRTAGTVLYFH